MAAKEVSCKTLTIFFKSLEENKIPLEILCENLQYNLDYLKNKNENIEWETLRKFLLNIRKIWDDDQFVNLGIQMVQKKTYPFFSLISGFFLNIKDVYHLINDPKKGIGNRHVKCVKPTTREIERGHLEVTLELPDNYIKSREFFLVTKGFFTALPLFLKLKFSKVIMHETEHGAVYNIFYPQSNKAYLWFRNIFSTPSSKRAAIAELNDAYELLYDRFHQLEESQAKIQMQARLLETAYSISQLIIGDLDLDYTLKAIAKSLVEVAEFKAVEVIVETEIEGEKINRKEKFGNQEINSDKIERILKGRSQTLGKITLWTNTENENVYQLLDYIIPSVSMQLLSALSFKLVDDYRSKLEHKVDERTGQLNQVNKELSDSLEKLKKLKSARDRFFANISHEFRTPLTLISGPSEDIINNTRENKTKIQTELIKKNADRMLELINQLLDLSRLDAGKIELKTSHDNIVSFIRGITLSFESLAERKGIMLAVSSNQEIIDFYFDKEMMIKIITNLLSNAFKYTKIDGQITVTINETNDKFIEIKIKDTGIGIPKEELPKLFDRFYQVDNSPTREYEGAGIGLALTKELVELHHGKIFVDSLFETQNPDKRGWTEFTIQLPAVKEHLKDLEIIEGIKTEIYPDTKLNDYQKTALKSLRDADNHILEINKNKRYLNKSFSNNDFHDDERNLILIVEDNRDVRNFIKDTLINIYQIEVSANGREGVDKAKDIIPDLIICDIMMPKMDGLELTKILKNDEATSHIPIILLTAKSEQEIKIEGLEFGADDYLIKPFDTKELKARIKNRIELRKQLQRKYSSLEYFENEKENKLTNPDEKFMSDVMNIIEKHLPEEDFSIEQLNKELGLGRVQVYRKIKALTGNSPSRFIRSVRLAKAKKMIKENKNIISEIAYAVGFSTPAYFARCFKEEFGYPPSEFVR